jgi:RNA polymerase sigma-70 factor (ECF subfamily)
MTQLIALPLATNEPRADALLFPEARTAPPADRASGNSSEDLNESEISEHDDIESLMNEPARHSGMHIHCDDRAPSSSRLVLATPQKAPSSHERLSALVRDQSRNVWRALRRLGVPVDLLDDATQEVFIIVSRKLAFIEANAERSFIYGTALRVAANIRRSRQAQVHDQLSESAISLWPSEPDAEQLVHRKHLREMLDQILDQMSDDLREVFVLFELEKLTRSELAELLSLPAGTVASRLRRAREFFEQACERLRDFPKGGPR